jgi:hypothetical protein
MKWLNLKKGELEEMLTFGAIILTTVIFLVMVIRFFISIFLPVTVIIAGIFVIGYVAKRTGLIEKIEKKLF